MSDHDPFRTSADAGPTVVRPMPGGRRPGGAQRPPQPEPHPGPGTPTEPLALPAAATDNRLAACATDLLTVAFELRGSPSHPNPEGLREQLTGQVRTFEHCARAEGLTDQVVLPARYVLCALIDEAVLDTPWGSQSAWAKRGLLISFHNEAWGGEKFYDAMDRLLAYPSGNLDLLELMYLCLAAGFEGRYRARDGGRDQLDRVRERLYQSIRGQRGEPERELSPHWQGRTERRDPLIHHLPLWVFGAIGGTLLLGLFAAFTFALSRDSDPVYLRLAGADTGLVAVRDRDRTPITAPPTTPPETPQPQITLRMLLASDIAAGRVEVIDRAQGQTVIIRGDGLFASARASVNDALLPLLRRIGDALGQLPGRVLVTGHSDSVPIKTLRFPSNWHLSQARADSVTALLAELTGEPGRFSAEGRADTEPRVPENPRDARNRRVEITLMPPTAGGSVSPGVAAPHDVPATGAAEGPASGPSTGIGDGTG